MLFWNCSRLFENLRYLFVWDWLVGCYIWEVVYVFDVCLFASQSFSWICKTSFESILRIIEDDFCIAKFLSFLLFVGELITLFVLFDHFSCEISSLRCFEWEFVVCAGNSEIDLIDAMSIKQSTILESMADIVVLGTCAVRIKDESDSELLGIYAKFVNINIWNNVGQFHSCDNIAVRTQHFSGAGVFIIITQISFQLPTATTIIVDLDHLNWIVSLF